MSIELAHKEMYVWFVAFNALPSQLLENNKLYVNDRTRKMDSKFLDVYLRVQPLFRDKSLTNVGIEKRNCRFWSENGNVTDFYIYTYSTCEIECIMRAHLLYCFCVAHILPKERGEKKKECGLDGLKCLLYDKKVDILNYVKQNCNCISNCNQLDVFNIGTLPNIRRESESFRDSRSQKCVNFIVQAPIVQYNRLVLKEPLDFIVSVGGTISLFIGCSFISLAQLIYYFVLKPISNYIRYKHREEELKKQKMVNDMFIKQIRKLKMRSFEHHLGQKIRIKIKNIEDLI